MVRVLLLSLIICGSLAEAMPIKVKIVRTRAFMQPNGKGMLEALDLKRKTLYFGKAEFEQCGTKLLRMARTLTYSCSFAINNGAKISKLHSVVSPKTMEVAFGDSMRFVELEVSENAREITFQTSFDATGVDFEISKFNDDFFAVYDKVAQLVIAEAIKNKPVQIEVLESR